MIAILFEGLDGVGKTYLIHEYAEYLRNEGKRVKIIKFPTKEVDFQELRKMHFIKQINMFFEQFEQVSLDLDESKWDYVLIDRMYPSTLVYQTILNYPEESIPEWLGTFEVLLDYKSTQIGFLIKPFLTIYIKANIRDREEMIEKRESKEYFENRETQKMISLGFDLFFENCFNGDYIEIKNDFTQHAVLQIIKSVESKLVE